ncbi:MAG: 23S rRNA (adenine(2503)-C(2))-methyltransferase RlmN [Chloroflexota bacterium]
MGKITHMPLPSTTLPAKSVLSDHGRADIDAWTRERGLPAYRGNQLWSALTQRAVQSSDELTDWPLSLRAELGYTFSVRSLETVVHRRSASDGAEKALFRVRGGGTVESVLIEGRNAGGGQRWTVCVSSQIGCPAACSFCATGLSGFTRNLSATEIVDQVMYFAHALRERKQRVSNVVFMGMGEPFLNVPAVRQAVQRLTDPEGFGLGDRHITVSTVGITPQVERFAEWGGQTNLAVSLHAPNDELRTQLVPYNVHFPLDGLLSATRTYIARTNRRVSFEYVLLRGVNDRPDLALELAELLRPFGGMAHINLIPWNPFREGRFIRSEGPDPIAFAAALQRRGLNATIRYSRGLDISAACGQLREQVGTGEEVAR